MITAKPTLMMRTRLVNVRCGILQRSLPVAPLPDKAKTCSKPYPFLTAKMRRVYVKADMSTKPKLLGVDVASIAKCMVKPKAHSLTPTTMKLNKFISA
ncbi:hypothetical protein OH492_16840 [Vibrio chagasii]|nr:hypothetical protein [Vibrio chagasii]